ncbi:hypothetical protein I8748_27595 [Nostoc sp. CENA67]|uniref:Uncharacterized protein n=1 Tax=Amazonocrinis nigriterrae CENA67 TaxID=2794033 RepID=A0A8J7HTY9_9NOST|nr:hypothetical protein [Amazonocrinis nigriterrae]MBH8565886.1 hypothetical protein [Amazonocrinis nigriterrae CENA67]
MRHDEENARNAVIGIQLAYFIDKGAIAQTRLRSHPLPSKLINPKSRKSKANNY